MELHPNLKTELRGHLDLLLKYRENRRNQEDIISDIIEILKDTNKDTFLPFLMQMMNSINLRYSSDIFKNLMSPLKQFAYIIDIYFSISHQESSKHAPTEDEWNKMTELLMEVEMTYFGEIGFYKENSVSLDIDKISISLKAFFDFYSNAQLSYDEQTLNRLQSNFKRFDDDLYEEYGFKTNDIVTFCFHINELLQSKIDKSFSLKNPDNWTKITSSFIERGISNPQDWIEQPELENLRNLFARPGYWFIQNKADILSSDLSNEISNKLIDFLKYDENKLNDKTIYYSEPREYFETPLIELSNEEFLCPNFKFLIEAFYNRINRKLSELKKEKYTQFKNKMLEEKTLEVLERFFGKDITYFKSFYFDKESKSEQDLLIFYKGTLLIIEIKDFKFRAPLRNPLKAFDKISSDFKGGIQKAYNQCKRLEDKIEQGTNFKIYDLKSNKELFEIRPNRIKNYYSIIVTQHKYGGIQTNLEELLIKDDEKLYPWSVCIDDLEIFLLCLKKIKKGNYIPSFLNYLENREYFHERLLCSDELEMCGLFMNSSTNFQKYAMMEEMFATDIRMSEIFDAHYANYLGFRNEINLNRKKENPIGNYTKKFDMNIVSGNDLTN